MVKRETGRVDLLEPGVSVGQSKGEKTHSHTGQAKHESGGIGRCHRLTQQHPEVREGRASSPRCCRP